MPVVESTVELAVDVDTAFAVSQTTGETRLRWDPFIAHQHLLDGATVPAKDVRTFTRHRSRLLSMTSRYVSYRPPTTVGMTMERGPWFFETFAAGWRFDPAGPGRSRATWRYSFRCRPSWIAPVAEAIGTRVLRRDVERRLAAFARGCTDPVVLAAVRQ